MDRSAEGVWQMGHAAEQSERAAGQIPHWILPAGEGLAYDVCISVDAELEGSLFGRFFCDFCAGGQRGACCSVGARPRFQVHQATSGFSRGTISLRKAAALVRPSSAESRLSSCSMERTLSYRTCA